MAAKLKPNSLAAEVFNAKPKVLIWDIETTDLKADFGRLMCFAYKWEGEKTVKLVSITDTKAFAKGHFWDDSELVKQLYSVLIQADSLVHHFGDRFDLKFFKTRLLELGLYFPAVHTVDTWKVAKKHLLLQSNRMANIASFLGGEQKTSVSKREWVMAGFGHKPSIQKIGKYCVQDVRTLADMFDKIKPYSNSVNLNLYNKQDGREGCPKCNSLRFVSNGLRYTAQSSYRRLQCCDCGTWRKGSIVTRSRTTNA